MPRVKKPVVQIEDGEWVTIEWKDQHEECCDCGLRHKLSYRIAEGGKLQFKASRLK